VVISHWFSRHLGLCCQYHLRRQSEIRLRISPRISRDLSDSSSRLCVAFCLRPVAVAMRHNRIAYLWLQCIFASVIDLLLSRKSLCSRTIENQLNNLFSQIVLVQLTTEIRCWDFVLDDEANCTNGSAFATRFCLSVSHVYFIVAKRCVLRENCLLNK